MPVLLFYGIAIVGASNAETSVELNFLLLLLKITLQVFVVFRNANIHPVSALQKSMYRGF